MVNLNELENILLGMVAFLMKVDLGMVNSNDNEKRLIRMVILLMVNGERIVNGMVK